jgi:hypothetical protein
VVALSAGAGAMTADDIRLCSRLSSWAFLASGLVRDNPCTADGLKSAVDLAATCADRIYAIRAAALAPSPPPA